MTPQFSLGAMHRSAMAGTSIVSGAPVNLNGQRMMTAAERDELTAAMDEMRGGLLPAGATESAASIAKRARRAARGDVPVVINRKPAAPVKPKRKSRAKNAA